MRVVKIPLMPQGVEHIGSQPSEKYEKKTIDAVKR
jgi:hypothetical protein